MVNDHGQKCPRGLSRLNTPYPPFRCSSSKFRGVSPATNRLKIRHAYRRSREVLLKRLLLVAVLVSILAPAGALAQVVAAPVAPAKATKVSFSGRIREDGRAILVEGRAWVVTNVEKLREHTGENVSVK